MLRRGVKRVVKRELRKNPDVPCNTLIEKIARENNFPKIEVHAAVVSELASLVR